MFALEKEIGVWKESLSQHGSLDHADVEELEAHLRDEVAALVDRSLNAEEAFLIAVRRIGATSEVAAEYARGRSRELWRQLFRPALSENESRMRRRTLALVLSLAALAGAAALLPYLFGITPFQRDSAAYLRFAGLIALVPTGAFLAVRRRASAGAVSAAVVTIVLAFTLALLEPWRGNAAGIGRQEADLFAIHLPILLWVMLLPVYRGGRTDGSVSPDGVDYLRVSGESLVYLALLYIGGAVLIAFTIFIFSAISLDAQHAAMNYVAVFGAFAAPVISVYFATEKRGVVESITPILARIFSPLFLAVMAGFLLAAAVLNRSPFANRELLIGVDLMLALVLAMVIYTVASRRREDSGRGFYDWLNAILILATFAIDLFALAAIASRISSAGLTPNRLAALGENVLLLVNLVLLGVGQIAVLVRRPARSGRPVRNGDSTPDEVGGGDIPSGPRAGTWIDIEAVLRLQVRYLWVYAVWAALVMIAFPFILR